MAKRSLALTRRSFLTGSGIAGALALSACSSEGAGDDGAAASGSGVDPSRRVTIAMSTTNEPDAGFDPCVAWGCG